MARCGRATALAVVLLWGLSPAEVRVGRLSWTEPGAEPPTGELAVGLCCLGEAVTSSGQPRAEIHVQNGPGMCFEPLCRSLRLCRWHTGSWGLNRQASSRYSSRVTDQTCLRIGDAHAKRRLTGDIQRIAPRSTSARAVQTEDKDAAGCGQRGRRHRGLCTDISHRLTADQRSPSRTQPCELAT